jgi:hypothetical protein
VVGCCEHGNEHSGFMKGRGFLDQLSDINFSRRTVLNGVNYSVN